MIHVLLDMDSVISDLVRGMNSFLNTNDSEKDRNKFFTNLTHFARQGGFQTLDKMKDADELVSFLVSLKKEGKINVSICTSSGHFYEPISEVVVQKKRWIEKNFPSLKMVPFIATTSGADKANFANKNTILIDDHHSNVNIFREKGGIAIQYDPNKNGLMIVKNQLNILLGKNAD